MEEIGVRTGPALILAGTLLLFVVVGILTRVRNLEEYWVAGRRIGPVSSGMAIASNWMSAASFLGMAGLLYLQGYFGLAYVLGWTGGYVLLLVLMAAQIRNYGKFTAPDFIGDRYYSKTARFLAAIITLVISFVYAVGQYKGIGEMFKWIFGMDYKLSIITGTIVVVSYVLLSGMMGVVRNQQVQYIVLITAFLLPLFFIAKKLGFFYVVPQVGYGEAVAQLQETQPQFVLPWGDEGIYQWIALCFTLMVGTAGLPHVIQRFYLVPNARDARKSVVWGLFFIGILYWSSPAFSAFGRILNPDGGREVADVIIINAAENAGLPEWFTGLLAAGAVSAAFSTVAGLLMAASAAFAHDLYFGLFKPTASNKERVVVARLGAVVLGFAIMVVALEPPALIGQIVAMAFAIAGCTIFPVFVLGIWWSRTTREGGIAGMLVGGLISIGALFWGDTALASWIPATSSALIGAPVAFLTIIVVSHLTPPPPKEIDGLMQQIHTGEDGAT